MKHMEIDDRNRLEFLAACGRSANQIAEDRGRSPSAIREEFIRHRIASDRGCGCSNRVCAHFDDCQRRIITAARDALRKNTPGCFEPCPNFREAVCHRLAEVPVRLQRMRAGAFVPPAQEVLHRQRRAGRL